MLLKTIRQVQLEPGKKYQVVIPIGSTEQHGPFLPFGADTYIGNEILKGLHEARPELVILPTLEYSCSIEHQEFAGSLWLKDATLFSILDDLCASVSDPQRGPGVYYCDARRESKGTEASA
jgi:creatinine amidohydrolase